MRHVSDRAVRLFKLRRHVMYRQGVGEMPLHLPECRDTGRRPDTHWGGVEMFERMIERSAS